MLDVKIFTTNPIEIKSTSFYPRNYSPNYIFVKNVMKDCPDLESLLSNPVTGGSTPPAYLFTDETSGIPFVKTSAIMRHFINVNDLHYVNEEFHKSSIKRSITKPYDVIYSMTGKYMGKAALCPPIIKEMNMSQNSVVLRTDSPYKSAFLTIFLNSEINKIQVRGNYSITKQKFLNQSKIAALKIVPYSHDYDELLEKYISGIKGFYESIETIKNIIKSFESDFMLEYKDDSVYGFEVNPIKFSKKMLVPNYYRPDIENTIKNVMTQNVSGHCLNMDELRKGDEVGSENYLEVGVPFIKTSDITNYDVDNEPNCYCSAAFINQMGQNIKKGDLIFTKDGKPGETAIIDENANVVLSSGLVKYHPKDDNERYLLFLLLSSKYGKAYFKKWFVIASTMTHLRKDFFEDFLIPDFFENGSSKYIEPLKEAFETKMNNYYKIILARDLVIEKFTETHICKTND